MDTLLLIAFSGGRFGFDILPKRSLDRGKPEENFQRISRIVFASSLETPQKIEIQFFRLAKFTDASID
jgi:hypothetical protein